MALSLVIVAKAGKEVNIILTMMHVLNQFI